MQNNCINSPSSPLLSSFSAVLTPNWSYSQEPIWSQCSAERKNFRISTNSLHFHRHTEKKYTFSWNRQTHYVFNRTKLRYHHELIIHPSLQSFYASVMHQQDASGYLVLLQEIIECEARILATCLHAHSIKNKCFSSISTCIQNSPTSAGFLYIS